ncbi:MAG: phosphate-selective porin, partial [bacterium]|nr:phosphate-selective porin [bacterium]
MSVRRLAVTAVVLALVAPALAQEQPDVAARVDDLARQLGEAQARIDRQAVEQPALRSDLDAQKDVHAAFRVGRFGVTLFGFVQADGVVYSGASVDELNPSTGAPLNETRFLIRRARLRADADYGYIAGALELDGNTVSGPTARITNVEVSACWPRCAGARPPLVMGTLGLLRIPFGFEVQEKDYVRLFLERSTVARALFPGEYDLGARLQGGWRWLRWQAAAMNGHPSGDKQLALVDPTASKDFLGRVGTDTRPHGRVGIVGGVSALYGTGFSRGAGSTKDTLVWRDANADGQVDVTEIVGVVGQPSTPSRTFSRYALGGDLRVTVELPRVGALTVAGEIVWATNLDRAIYVADPLAAGRDLRELGWYVGVTQQLTRWCAVGVRYDRYDPDADARQQVGATIVPRDKTFATLSIVAAAM